MITQDQYDRLEEEYHGSQAVVAELEAQIRQLRGALDIIADRAVNALDIGQD